MNVRMAAVHYLLRRIGDWDSVENHVRFIPKAAAEYKPGFVVLRRFSPYSYCPSWMLKPTSRPPCGACMTYAAVSELMAEPQKKRFIQSD